MSEDNRVEPSMENVDGEFAREVAAKQRRKLKAKRSLSHHLWINFSTFGVIGWSISVPVLVGIAIGLFIDSHMPSQYSWTLMLLTAGLFLGCYNAWRWLKDQNEKINKEQEEAGDD